MIDRSDILSIEFLKKSEYTGSYRGMRYRIEKTESEEEGKRLLATVWPEPYNYFNTAEEKKIRAYFSFDEDGIVKIVEWMSERWQEDKDRWTSSFADWDA